MTERSDWTRINSAANTVMIWRTRRAQRHTVTEDDLRAQIHGRWPQMDTKEVDAIIQECVRRVADR